jgi:hypothetical protein
LIAVHKEIKEFILKGTINNTVPFLRDGFLKLQGTRAQGTRFLKLMMPEIDGNLKNKVLCLDP